MNMTNICKRTKNNQQKPSLPPNSSPPVSLPKGQPILLVFCVPFQRSVTHTQTHAHLLFFPFYILYSHTDVSIVFFHLAIHPGDHFFSLHTDILFSAV